MPGSFKEFNSYITVIYHAINKIKLQEMAPAGLKGADVPVLSELGTCPDGLTAAQLCERCDLDKAAVSRSLTRLQEKNLIRITAQNRKYRALVLLTDEGARLARQVNDKINRYFESYGERFSEPQKEAFYNALENIAARLKTLSEADSAGTDINKNTIKGE